MLQSIDELDKKIKDPLFPKATGPFIDYAARQSVTNPARLIYKLAPEKDGVRRPEAQALHGRILADAQIIKSQMQQVFLKGQGAVTEWERKSVNDIVGEIAAARSTKEAQDQMKNLRTLVGIVLQKGLQVPGAPKKQPAEATTPAAPATPEPPPKAIEALRANPQRAREFEAYYEYSSGSAARYLNAM